MSGGPITTEEIDNLTERLASELRPTVAMRWLNLSNVEPLGETHLSLHRTNKYSRTVSLIDATGRVIKRWTLSWWKNLYKCQRRNGRHQENYRITGQLVKVRDYGWDNLTALVVR